MKVMLPMKDGSNIPPKDNEIILYDKTSGYYYTVTDEVFLKNQNEKINGLLHEVQRLETLYAEQIEKVKKLFGDSKQELIDNYNNFLIQYQKTNATIIEMVESVVKGENK